MMTASASTTTSGWVVLGVLTITSMFWPANEIAPMDTESDDGVYTTRLGLDLESTGRLEIVNPLGETRVEHADVTRVAITSGWFRVEDSPRGETGPTPAGWRFAISPRGVPRETIDLVVTVPRATTVIVNGL
jgi:hypothetical protein